MLSNRSPLSESIMVKHVCFVATATISLAANPVAGQAGARTASERVYNAASPSVFLIEALGKDGRTVAIGSGFVVRPNELVTNAHVVEKGTPVLRIGPLKTSLTVIRIDAALDLALVKVEATLDAPPLKMRTTDLPTGAAVFAVGNPAGLERSISSGLANGIRTVQSRSLLQISAAISPGSSGGPVLDEESLVVGVAVGSFRDAQNLNFAIPAKQLSDFLEQPSANASGQSLATAIDRIQRLRSELGVLPYSADSTSQYARTSDRLDALVDSTLMIARTTEELTTLLEVLRGFYEHAASVIGERLLQKVPDSRTARIAIAEYAVSVARWRAEDESEKKTAIRTAERVLAPLTTGRQDREALLLLANAVRADTIQSLRGYELLQSALRASVTLGTDSLIDESLTSLIEVTTQLNRFTEAKNYLGTLRGRDPEAFLPIRTIANRLDDLQRYSEAADMWLQAASVSGLAYDYCEAGTSLSATARTDDMLAASRRCIAIHERNITEYAKRPLSRAHYDVSEALFERGVNDEAISHARSSISLVPANAWAHSILSKALNQKGSFAEAVASAKEALRLSDGKYSSMHFALGSAYFNLEDWRQARESFSKAYELDPKEPAALYNLALAYARDSFFSQAATLLQQLQREHAAYAAKKDVARLIALYRK